ELVHLASGSKRCCSDAIHSRPTQQPSVQIMLQIAIYCRLKLQIFPQGLLQWGFPAVSPQARQQQSHVQMCIAEIVHPTPKQTAPRSAANAPKNRFVRVPDSSSRCAHENANTSSPFQCLQFAAQSCYNSRSMNPMFTDSHLCPQLPCCAQPVPAQSF